ncbi:hypothetical protein FHR32_007817 [Streptosporangium album]|uniref:Uncharacterized protein n=1 Tax=Streptosporangium album TaxID=47479 RepID=A0A7W7S4L3_9ACTN|nr:hypothetical protein [Streptosporangium album]
MISFQVNPNTARSYATALRALVARFGPFTPVTALVSR